MLRDWKREQLVTREMERDLQDKEDKLAKLRAFQQTMRHQQEKWILERETLIERIGHLEEQLEGSEASTVSV